MTQNSQAWTCADAARELKKRYRPSDAGAAIALADDLIERYLPTRGRCDPFLRYLRYSQDRATRGTSTFGKLASASGIKRTQIGAIVSLALLKRELGDKEFRVVSKLQLSHQVELVAFAKRLHRVLLDNGVREQDARETALASVVTEAYEIGDGSVRNLHRRCNARVFQVQHVEQLKAKRRAQNKRGRLESPIGVITTKLQDAVGSIESVYMPHRKRQFTVRDVLSQTDDQTISSCLAALERLVDRANWLEAQLHAIEMERRGCDEDEITIAIHKVRGRRPWSTP